MKAVKKLEGVFDQIRALPDDEQFVEWNDIIKWLQGAMSEVAALRRQALHRYRQTNQLTRNDLAAKFGLTFTTVSRLMDEADKSGVELTEGS